MKKKSHAGKKGGVGKTRITIRLDNEVVSWFREQVEERGGGNYQSLINTALNEHIYSRSDYLKGFIQRVVQEEISKTSQGK